MIRSRDTIDWRIKSKFRSSCCSKSDTKNYIYWCHQNKIKQFLKWVRASWEMEDKIKDKFCRTSQQITFFISIFMLLRINDMSLQIILPHIVNGMASAEQFSLPLLTISICLSMLPSNILGEWRNEWNSLEQCLSTDHNRGLLAWGSSGEFLHAQMLAKVAGHTEWVRQFLRESSY